MPEALWYAMAIGALGLVLVGYGVSIIVKARRSLAWPTAQGKVLDSRVASSTYRGSTVYLPHVLYEYTVNGHSHQGTHRGVGNPVGLSEAAASLALARYDRGATVWVFYNPADPNDSLLEHVAPSSLAWIGIGLAAVLLAVWGAVRTTT